MLRQDDFEDHVEQGRANVEAIELVRRHCLHARIEMVGGNSMVGSMLGIPMGLLEIRCKHAPPPTSASHRVLDLAVEFYRRNCVGCTKRQATGEVPNLSVVVAERDEEEERHRRSKEKEALERAYRHGQRKVRRQLAVAAEGYVVRDLANWIDRLDGPEPKTSAVTPDEEEANRQIIKAARHAPKLFTPVFVETLLGLAADTAEATAFVALSELVTAKRCEPRAVVEAALGALAVRSEAEAAKLLYSFKNSLRQNDLPSVLDRLIDMVSRQTEPFGPKPVPEGIRAAAAVDLQAVLNRLVSLLDSDNESERGAAADAAAILLHEIPSIITALGPALVTSIRAEDLGYAGYPTLALPPRGHLLKDGVLSRNKQCQSLRTMRRLWRTMQGPFSFELSDSFTVGERTGMLPKQLAFLQSSFAYDISGAIGVKNRQKKHRKRSGTSQKRFHIFSYRI